MLVLGVDPGTASTGFGLVSQAADGTLLLVECGVIETSPAESPPNRLLELHRSLAELVGNHRPGSAAVEKLFFQKNVSTAMGVGQARGVILLTMAQASVPVYEYEPREVKLAMTGYGNADKRQIQAMVAATLQLSSAPKPDDAADALALAICHLTQMRLKERLREGD